jgi:hypothetical protein
MRTRVQRAPLATAPTAAPARAATPSADAGPSAPQQVKVHRGGAASELADSLQARAFTHEGEIYLPSSAGPLGSTAARRLIAHEMTHVAQQRTHGRSLPDENSSRGEELERMAVAAEQRLDLPLAQAAAGADGPTPQQADLGKAQRKAAAPTAPTTFETTTLNIPAPVQRAPISSDIASPPPPTANAGPRPQSEAELEALAGQLYGRISRRLRRELLVDRERSGVMVDLR